MNIAFPLALITFFAGFTQGLSGFGSILISLPLLALFLDIKTVIPLVSLFALVINTIIIYKMHKHLRWKDLCPLLLATILGIPTGVYILKIVPPHILQLTLGFILILFASYTLFIKLPQKQLSPRWAWLAGFTAGCLGGSLGANGPPIIIYTAIQPWTKNKIKSTLAGYFFVAGIGISSTHALTGLITPLVLKLFFLGLIFLILGVVTGMFCYKRLSDQKYRQFISILLLTLGIVMLTRGMSG
ncbi:sulfite exporter TauE/SafE family protein [Desulfovulcanus sp.]